MKKPVYSTGRKQNWGGLQPPRYLEEDFDGWRPKVVKRAFKWSGVGRLMLYFVVSLLVRTDRHMLHGCYT